MRQLRQEAGFTLPELMIGMTLMLIVTFASLTTLEQFTMMGKRGERKVDLQEQARSSTRQMARALRNVAGSSETADVIERAEPYDLVFKVVDESGADAGSNLQRLERIRYCLDTSGTAPAQIHQQTQSWNTATVPVVPPAASCPAPGWDSSRVLADQVSNAAGGASRPVWTYRLTNGQVSAVSVNLWMDNDLAREPREVALSTGVFLRNQNRPPVASFTATAAGVSHVLLNGSGSYDPEGHPLDMVWTVGTTQIGEGVNLDWNAGTAGSRTITLTVSDPSDLTGSVSQTVVVQ